MFVARLTAGARRVLLQERAKLSARRRQLSSEHQVVPEEYKHFIKPDMNNGYPLPTLLYSEAFAARNAKANKWLALSVLGLLGSIGFALANDAFSYLAPPTKEVAIFDNLDSLKRDD